MSSRLNNQQLEWASKRLPEIINEWGCYKPYVLLAADVKKHFNLNYDLTNVELRNILRSYNKKQANPCVKKRGPIALAEKDQNNDTDNRNDENSTFQVKQPIKSDRPIHSVITDKPAVSKNCGNSIKITEKSSPEEVKAYLLKNGFKNCQWVITEDIDGFSLSQLTHDKLWEFGVLTFGERCRLLKIAKEYQMESDNSDPKKVLVDQSLKAWGINNIVTQRVSPPKPEELVVKVSFNCREMILPTIG
jgi:hypothetical protein